MKQTTKTTVTCKGDRSTGKRIWLVLFTLLWVNAQLFAGLSETRSVQDHTVKGTVTDEQGNLLPGVNVMEVGTTNGVTTDYEGNYTITIESADGTLEFSYVGYTTQQVNVDGRETVDVTLVEDIRFLDEFVVIGYGTSKRRDILGSVSSVGSEELTEIPSASFDAALQGRASGLQVTQSGATPGGKVRVLIRGVNSISSATEPLYIIDGIPVDNGITSKTRGDAINPLSTLNPNDIESVEVLKDAAATAIYGSRGSNGVILITTKGGRTGESVTTFDVRTGFSNPLNLIDFVDGPQWLSLVDQARSNAGLDPFDPNSIVGDFDPTVTLSRDQAANTNTDWYDVALQQGVLQEYNFSTSRGTENASYYLSAQYRDEEGILVGSNMSRFNVRSNIDFKPTDNLSTGARINYSQVHNDEAPNGGVPGGNENIAKGGYNMAASGALPILPIYNADGTLFDRLSGRNLKASQNRDHINFWSDHYRVLGTLFATYDIPFIEGLSITGDVSADYMSTNSMAYGSGFMRPSGVSYGFDEGKQYYNLNYDAYFSYNRSFADDHNIALTLGTETFHTRERERNLEATNLTTSDQEIGAVAGDNIQRVVYGNMPETKFRGYFARANYNFMNKYYAGISYRRDGSSKFGSANRFGDFTAFSAGWVLSEEEFLADNATISFLKLRGSFGQTGNASIPQGITQTQFLTWTRYGNTGSGSTLNNIGASDITWEVTNSIDVGFDYGLIDNRLEGSIAYYYQDVSDMLLQVPIGVSAGTSRIWANIGDLLNRGVEFNINSVNVNTGDFMWTTGFNFTTSNNEIGSLTPVLAESRAGIDAGITTTRIGGILGAYYLAASAGIDETYGHELIYEIDNDPFLEDGSDNPNYGEKTGELLPATEGNVATNRYVHEDKSGLPTFYGGINNAFSYKGFTFSFLLSFQGGNYIYDSAEQMATSVGSGRNVIREDYADNYWTTSNKDADYPALTWENRYTYLDADGEETVGNFSQQTDRYLYKGDFMRLRNIQLGYTLPQNLTQRLAMKEIRIYVSASNLLTFTNYPGLDPELIATGGSAESRNLVQGVAGSGLLPQTRSFNTGVTVSF